MGKWVVGCAGGWVGGRAGARVRVCVCLNFLLPYLAFSLNDVLMDATIIVLMYRSPHDIHVLGDIPWPGSR